MNKLVYENYLLILKGTVEVYIHGTLESSNKKVKDLLKKTLIKILDMQEATYNEMTKEGWYQVNDVEPCKIKETLEKVKNS